MDSRVVFKDGEPHHSTHASVSLTSPMWAEGRSLFETLLVRPQGELGLYREGDHISRLVTAARNLRWHGVPSPDVLGRWVKQAAAAFRQKSLGMGRMRLTVVWADQQYNPDTYVTVVPYEPSTSPLYVKTTNIRLGQWNLGPVPKSGNRLVYQLAEQIAVENGADEGLLIDDMGYPLEGSKSNLFAVRDNLVFTPSLSKGVLPGITRQRVLHLAQRADVTVREVDREHELESFQDATGFFMTNALWGIRPIGRMDKRVFDHEQPAISALRNVYDEDVRAYLQTGNEQVKLL